MHYLAVKNVSALLRGITSKQDIDFYQLNCLHCFATENNLELYKKVCENKDFWNVIMSSEDTTILDFNQYQKSDEEPFIIYGDLERLVEKIDGCKNNPENSFKTIVGKYILSGLLMSTKLLFKDIQKKYDVYRGKNCMKKFCETLREHAMQIIGFKKMKLLTEDQ